MEEGRLADATLLRGAGHDSFGVCDTTGRKGECSSTLLQPGSIPCNLVSYHSMSHPQLDV